MEHQLTNPLPGSSSKPSPQNPLGGVLASLPPEALDQLVQLVISRLNGQTGGACFPSKEPWVRIPSPAP